MAVLVLVGVFVLVLSSGSCLGSSLSYCLCSVFEFWLLFVWVFDVLVFVGVLVAVL